MERAKPLLRTIWTLIDAHLEDTLAMSNSKRGGQLGERLVRVYGGLLG